MVLTVCVEVGRQMTEEWKRIDLDSNMFKRNKQREDEVAFNLAPLLLSDQVPITCNTYMHALVI